MAKKSAPAFAVAPFSAAVAKRHQRSWARHLRQRVVVTNSIGMKLTLIPPGEFVMGSPTTEPDRTNRETQHRVKITKPFLLGAHEVTQDQYQQVMGANPSKFVRKQLQRIQGNQIILGAKPSSPTRRGCPVEQVRWQDALAFCRRLSAGAKEKSAGRIYRLPTEAEWEYACRAGTVTAFSFGGHESGLLDHAWFEANANQVTHLVGQGKPNAFGLYDMHGNVTEWCADWFDATYYQVSPALNPPGPGNGRRHVQRGGGWDAIPRDVRSADRDGNPPLDRGVTGFRVAVSVSD